MFGLQINPQSRTDGQYILSLALAVADMQKRSRSPISRATAAFKASREGEVVLCDATSGAFTVTLPPAQQFYGCFLWVKKMDSSGNAITVDGNASETIDGVATKSISTQYATLALFSTGEEWVLL